MKTVKSTLNLNGLSYPLAQIAPLDDILFLDIETTGFQAKSSVLYLIGCAFWSGKSWDTVQWFAESYEEEYDILKGFLSFARKYGCLIHFNGSAFDVPFILQKSGQYGLDCPLEQKKNVDLYKNIAPCRFFLKLPNCKLKTLEEFLKIQRRDTCDGKELIETYRNYIKAPTDSAKNTILLHNKEDLRGMLKILPMLSYYDLFARDVTAKKVQANYYRDLSGQKGMELLMTLKLPSSLPCPVSASANQCYFSGEGDAGMLKVPVFEEEMKYFYSNYRDYYYLPEEDTALHRSVAGFVDSEHRVPATASTCYTRKFSQYLPQWGMFREPFFKRDYQSKELFFELTGELKKDRAAFSAYANHVLAMIVSTF